MRFIGKPFRNPLIGARTGLLIGVGVASSTIMTEGINHFGDPASTHCLNVILAGAFFGAAVGFLNSLYPRHGQDPNVPDWMDNISLLMFVCWGIVNTWAGSYPKEDQASLDYFFSDKTITPTTDSDDHSHFSFQPN